jgi:hypothetical protein
MSRTISKKIKGELIHLGKELDVHGVAFAAGVSATKIIISVAIEQDAQRVVEIFERRFPRLSFLVRRIEAASFLCRPIRRRQRH